MTQPALPWNPITVRPGPSGNARAGSTQGFTNLSADLDTNFASFRTWATKVDSVVTPVVYGPGSAWFSVAAGWTLYTAPNELQLKRVGRLVIANFLATYAGTVVANASGDISPDLLVGTITEVTCRPAVTVYLTGMQYGASTYGISSLRVYPDGTMYLTGFSAAQSVTNPGVGFTTCWVSGNQPPALREE